MRLNEGPQKRPRITSSEPEYGDARDVQRIFGLKEALLYLLDRDGQVKSVSIKGRGQSRGKRLYDFASIRALLGKGHAIPQPLDEPPQQPARTDRITLELVVKVAAMLQREPRYKDTAAEELFAPAYAVLSNWAKKLRSAQIKERLL